MANAGMEYLNDFDYLTSTEGLPRDNCKSEIAVFRKVFLPAIPTGKAESRPDCWHGPTSPP